MKRKVKNLFSVFFIDLFQGTVASKLCFRYIKSKKRCNFCRQLQVIMQKGLADAFKETFEASRRQKLYAEEAYVGKGYRFPCNINYVLKAKNPTLFLSRVIMKKLV